jgi:acylphosphatase
VAKTAARIIVSGIVQGVGYRYWTARMAQELGLCGWVRNLYDGRVEIWAEGERPQLDELVRRCERGPRAAEVDAVDREDAEVEGHDSFTTRRDAPG